MDPQVIFTGIQNFGAMAILAIMVLKSPAIISAISTMIDNNIKNVRETQTEALNVFKSENEKILGMVAARFETIENVLKSSVDTQTQVLGEMKTLAERVGALERDKPS